MKKLKNEHVWMKLVFPFFITLLVALLLIVDETNSRCMSVLFFYLILFIGPLLSIIFIVMDQVWFKTQKKKVIWIAIALLIHVLVFYSIILGYFYLFFHF